MTERGGLQGLIWGAAALAAVLVAVKLLGGSQPAPPVELAAGTAAQARGEADAGARPRRLPGPYVHVAGAVRRPGLYRLAEGARVAAAVERAGGPLARAGLGGINLAARVVDGQQVIVPARVTAAAAAGAQPGEPTAPISLGSATVEQLEQLDGIGPTLAARIVEHRAAIGGFASVDQLDDVDGIGEGRLAALREALAP